MDINYLGHSSFRIKGRGAGVVTDPYNEKCGKYPRDVVAEIVTVSHDHADHNQTQLVGGSPFIVNGPGEYEIKGVSIIGIPSFHDDKKGVERGANTIYVFEVDGMRLVHVGDLGHKLSDGQLEDIGPVDIAMIPVGGEYTIDAKMAAEVAHQLDPWIIIPMHYKQAGLNEADFGKLTGVDEFLKEMGATVVPISKLSVTRDKLPQETQVIVLERK